MLLEFTVANYRSFREPVTLSLVADARLSERDKTVDARNLVRFGDLDVLRAAAIYGANASGKSNLVRAMGMFRRLVLNSSREGQAGDRLPVEPFRLDAATQAEPTSLEAVFTLGARQVRYGFSATPAAVAREWLFVKEAAGEEVLGFERTGDAYEAGPAWTRDVALEEKTRREALHVSVAAAFNHGFAGEILGWAGAQLKVVEGLGDHETLDETSAYLDGGPHHAAIVALVKRIDVGIEDLHLEEDPVFGSSELDRALSSYFGTRFALNVLHSALDKPTRNPFSRHRRAIQSLHRDPAGGPPVAFDFADESAGTQKVIALAGPVVATLAAGSVLVVDEFDARLHTLLAMELVGLFQSATTNPHGAQLVFASHDTNLLSRALLRRDQLWFVEKSRKTQSSALYSLADVRLDGKRVRNDARYEVEYLAGRYGAVPFFGNLGAILGEALATDDAEEP